MPGQQDQDMAQSNAQHSHFTKLIEDIILVLQPCFAKSAAETATVSNTKYESIDEIMNRFAALEVEEPTEEAGEEAAKPSLGTSRELILYDVEPLKTRKDTEADFCGRALDRACGRL